MKQEFLSFKAGVEGILRSRLSSDLSFASEKEIVRCGKVEGGGGERSKLPLFLNFHSPLLFYAITAQPCDFSRS